MDHLTPLVRWSLDAQYIVFDVSCRWSNPSFPTVDEIFSLRDLGGGTIMTICSHITSSVTWPLESKFIHYGPRKCANFISTITLAFLWTSFNKSSMSLTRMNCGKASTSPQMCFRTNLRSGETSSRVWGDGIKIICCHHKLRNWGGLTVSWIYTLVKSVWVDDDNISLYLNLLVNCMGIAVQLHILLVLIWILFMQSGGKLIY